MKFLGGLLKPIWASHKKVVELERDLDIITQYAADYWFYKKEMSELHEKEMSELKELVEDTRSKMAQLQWGLDYLKKRYVKAFDKDIKKALEDVKNV